MSNPEGVIKFDLAFRSGPAPAAELLRELDAWRRIFRRLGLLGQDPARYGGLGFGNLSRRLPQGGPDNAFLISGTQTGHLDHLAAAHYATVLTCDPLRNRIEASGPTPPSSEALSHAVLYQTNPRIGWVMHLHSPEIFAAGTRLGFPVTDPVAPYGSPAMAAEIARLYPLAGWPGLLVMGGHADGILVFGPTAVDTGGRAVSALAEALAFPSRQK